MQNIQADTAMRKSLSNTENEKAEKLASKRDSSSAPRPIMPSPNSGFGGFGQAGNGAMSQPMNPLAARFASLAAAQRKNNTDTDNNK